MGNGGAMGNGWGRYWRALGMDGIAAQPCGILGDSLEAPSCRVSTFESKCLKRRKSYQIPSDTTAESSVLPTPLPCLFVRVASTMCPLTSELWSSVQIRCVRCPSKSVDMCETESEAL